VVLIRSSAGISCRESPAHRAQKFTNTTSPRNSDMRRLLPSIAFSTKSGASLPGRVGGAAAIDGAADAAQRISQPASNALRMRRAPHRNSLELMVFETRPQHGDEFFTLVTRCPRP